ncbi:hypothetical protein [Nonomuraea fuscirosea]|uniref:hypothetical protein n=1 Tax=Nonomuraea fuscirosea TaxID=1291556 RepID=UPI00340E67FB
MTWTAIREEDGSVLVPFHVDREGWHADGAVRLQSGDPEHGQHLGSTFDARDFAAGRAGDEELIARWEQQYPALPARRSA